MRLASGLLALLAVISTISCSKKQEAALRDNLTGTWKKYKVAWDDNNNEKADAKEMHTVPDYLAQSITFSREGTGTIVTKAPRTLSTATFTWIVADKEHIRMTITTNGSYSETEYEITRLKGNELILRTNTPSLKSDVAWEYYVKQ